MPGTVPRAPCRCVGAVASGGVAHRGAQVFIASFVKAFRFYLPIHFVPYIIRHYRDVWSHQGFLMLRKRVGLDTLKSSLFLALYTSVWTALVCVFRNFEKRDRPFHIWLAGFICSSAVLIEPKGRRSELNIYTLARWMSMGYRAMVERGYVAYHKNGEVPLFAFAMSVIMYAPPSARPVAPDTHRGRRYYYQHDSSKVRNSLLSLMKPLYGVN